MYAKASERSPKEILQDLWDSIEENSIQWATRGPQCFLEKEPLLSYLRQLQTNSDEISALMEGKTTQESVLRVLRSREEFTRSSCGQELQERQPEEYTDSLHSLSQILARHAREAWIDNHRKDADHISPWSGDWERDIPRVITGQKDRAKRLKALGNAIVPECVMPIMEEIKIINQ